MLGPTPEDRTPLFPYYCRAEMRVSLTQYLRQPHSKWNWWRTQPSGPVLVAENRKRRKTKQKMQEQRQKRKILYNDIKKSHATVEESDWYLRRTEPT
jgi:hypothetical protein